MKVLFLSVIFICILQVARSQNYYYNPVVSNATPCGIPSYVNFTLSAISYPGFSLPDSVKFVVYYADGHADSSYFQMLSFDSVICSATHSYAFTGIYNPRIKITWPDLHADTISLPPVFVTLGCTEVSGYIFKDLNGNCTYENTIDTPIPYQMITAVDPAQPDTVYRFISNYQGYYQGSVPSGATYNIFTAFNNYFIPACIGSSPSTFNATGADVHVNWAATCNNLITINTWVYGNNFRPGFNPYMHTFCTVSNYCGSGNQTITGTLELDPLVTYNQIISGGSPTFYNSDYVEWNHTVQPGIQQFITHSTLNLLPAAQLGDLAYFKYRISPLPTQSDTSFNTDDHVHVVINSYDPNIIDPSPAEGTISFGQTLTYLIHFQNTGNDTAYNIFILDTLDPELDLSTFQILGASHTMSVDYMHDGKIKFNFYNINLPDSGASYELSQGFVAYKITLKNGLSIGTQIKNTAYIYFDINPPVQTNTTLHTIGVLGTNDIPNIQNSMIKPNPASTYFEMSGTGNYNHFRICDLKGIRFMDGPIKNRDKIDVSGLNEGVYFINLYSESGASHREKVVIMR